MADEKLEDVDWTHYIQRESPLYLFFANLTDYNIKLGEATGYGIKHQFYVYNQSLGTFYMSAKELKESERHIFDVITKNNPKVKEWLAQGKRCNIRAEKYLDECQGRDVLGAEDYQKAAELFEQVLLWGTILPFRVLAAIERAQQEGKDTKDIGDTLKAFEALRSVSFYPKMLREIFPVFWKEAAKRRDVSDWYLFSALTRPEMERLFRGEAHPAVEEMKQRIDWCAFWADEDTIMFSHDIQHIKTLGIGNEEKNAQGNICGQVAFPGQVKGKVRIVNRLEDAQGFEEGNIIVSINTNPSLTPLFGKCGGIVTDEGGMGCHAAIVSRELKIPCVVGTKYATRVFKDGDMVEVDATNGIVRKVDGGSHG